MKLAIDCRMIGSGGIGSYISSLLPLFIKENETLLIGNEVTLKEFSYYENVKIIPCDIKTFSLKELFSFPKEILNSINSCDAYYSPYCNIPSGIKIPIFSTIHDVVFLDVPGLTSKAGTLIRKCFYQYAVNKSKTVFTVSEFSAQRIKKHLHCKKTPVTVTYNSVPHWFTENIDPDIQKNNSILFVGNIKKHKGLHTLVAAYRILLQQNFSAKLVIVGNADNFRTGDDSISQEINSLPKDSIIFTGRISDSELKQCYQQANLLIQPSLYEGFGMPPLEALSLGTNVVLSDIPVFKEIYKDFPVIFFEKENAADLAQKISSSINLPSPQNLPQKYSFEITADIILKTIWRNINE